MFAFAFMVTYSSHVWEHASFPSHTFLRWSIGYNLLVFDHRSWIFYCLFVRSILTSRFGRCWPLKCHFRSIVQVCDSLAYRPYVQCLDRTGSIQSSVLPIVVSSSCTYLPENNVLLNSAAKQNPMVPQFTSCASDGFLRCGRGLCQKGSPCFREACCCLLLLSGLSKLQERSKISVYQELEDLATPSSEATDSTRHGEMFKSWCGKKCCGRERRQNWAAWESAGKIQPQIFGGVSRVVVAEWWAHSLQHPAAEWNPMVTDFGPPLATGLSVHEKCPSRSRPLLLGGLLLRCVCSRRLQLLSKPEGWWPFQKFFGAVWSRCHRSVATGTAGQPGDTLARCLFQRNVARNLRTGKFRINEILGILKNDCSRQSPEFVAWGAPSGTRCDPAPAALRGAFFFNVVVDFLRLFGRCQTRIQFLTQLCIFVTQWQPFKLGKMIFVVARGLFEF